MARKSKDQPDGEPESTMMFTVVAKQPSRMRAGLQFGSVSRDVELTEEQYEAIKADPLMVITPVTSQAASTE